MEPRRRHLEIKARELAMQLLFLADVREKNEIDLPLFFKEHLAEFADEQGSEKTEEVRERATDLYEGVLAHRDAIDEDIQRIARNWDLNRMATVDRNVLRLAMYEMSETDVPPKVAINEAIELAKKFSTARSSGFVNGILDRYLQERNN